MLFEFNDIYPHGLTASPYPIGFCLWEYFYTLVDKSLTLICSFFQLFIYLLLNLWTLEGKAES